MIARILGIILPVFVVILVGYFYARRFRPDMSQVNHLSMLILGPALIFSALASKEFDLGANVWLIAGSIGVVVGSGLLAWPVSRLMKVDYRTLVPTAMFNNCGNMGLPLAVLAFGQAGFSAMVALFTISNLLQFTVGIRIIDHHAKLWQFLRNPMVWATALGFAVRDHAPADARVGLLRHQDGRRRAHSRHADLARRAPVRGALGRLAHRRDRRHPLPVTGIAMALILAPVLGLSETQRGLLILFGSLPPAVLNFMVAEQMRQEPAKVASIVLIGNVMSVIFVPVGLALAIE
jgi:predicted permease